MAYNPTFVILSSLKPLFFNSLKNELRFSDNVEHKTPESNKSVRPMLLQRTCLTTKCQSPESFAHDPHVGSM